MSSVIIMSQDDRPLPLNAGGFMISVLASRETASGYEIFHQSGPAGKGPELRWNYGNYGITVTPHLRITVTPHLIDSRFPTP